LDHVISVSFQNRKDLFPNPLKGTVGGEESTPTVLRMIEFPRVIKPGIPVLRDNVLGIAADVLEQIIKGLPGPVGPDGHDIRKVIYFCDGDEIIFGVPRVLNLAGNRQGTIRRKQEVYPSGLARATKASDGGSSPASG